MLELPRGATPVDFAYSVHTEVGHQCVGAKVNGQMVSLRHEIVSGDVVEILTQKGHTPEPRLAQLRQVVPREKQNPPLDQHRRSAKKPRRWGSKLLENESRNFAAGPEENPRSETGRSFAPTTALSKTEDLYAAVGFGKYSARQVLARVFGEPEKEAEAEAEDSKPTLVKTVKRMLGFGEAPLIVKGHDDLLVYRAKCCNPIPGDDIVGYITRGRGVAVHTRTCPNVQNLLYQTERRIAVEWGGESTATFPVELQFARGSRRSSGGDHRGHQRSGLQHSQLESRPDRQNARIDASLEISDRRQLETILANIRRINGVYGVERTYQV